MTGMAATIMMTTGGRIMNTNNDNNVQQLLRIQIFYVCDLDVPDFLAVG